MKKFLSTIATKIRSSKVTIKSSAKTIYEQELFHKLIQHERDRVHRNDRQFSLLLIHINEKDNTEDCIKKIVQKISKRVRKIDQLGWYDDNYLGVLLPNTSYIGAKVFANDICKSQSDTDIPIVFETLSYPNNN